MSFTSTKYYPIVLIPENILNLYNEGISEEDIPEIEEPVLLNYPDSPRRPDTCYSESYRTFKWKAIFEVIDNFITFSIKTIWYSFLVSVGLIIIAVILPLADFLVYPILYSAVQYPYYSLLVVIVIVLAISIYRADWWTTQNRYLQKNADEIKKENDFYEKLEREWNYTKSIIDNQNAEIIREHNNKFQRIAGSDFTHKKGEFTSILQKLIFSSSQPEEMILSSSGYPLSDAWIKSEVTKLILDGCQPFVKAKKAQYITSKGRSESYFEAHLKASFGDKILSGQITEDDIFYPDFVYVCSETGIHIDIEIDEPYTLNTKEPIHYKNDEDENRNNYFIGNNWCVVRFTEKQVVEDTETCIKYLKEFTNHFNITTFMQKNHYLEFPADDYNSDFTFYTKKWSEKKAKKLAKRNFREEYLGPAGLL
jgi:hypothetical protein